MNNGAKEINAVDQKARAARLKFLIEKSKIYTTILAEKLEAQQSKARDAGNASPPDEKSRASSTTAQLSDSDVERKVTPKRKTRKGRQSRKSEPVSSPKAPPSRRQPDLITGGEMRDYQLAGLEWMVSLYENGLNGILADEMGLGKTLQTISFLAFLRGKGIYGPFLITAPMSTIANWVLEVERFAPTIPVVLYYGTKDERAELRRKRLGKVDEHFPIVVTSYEIVMNDRKFLQKYLWKYIVVDEGHRLKNLNCKLIKELKSYHSANRLLLTGTPLQNNLAELWSLLNFLLPDIFTDLESFQSWFDFSEAKEKTEQQGEVFDDKDQQNSIIESLHQILRPFLLRRLKTDVEKGLPRKREYLLYAPMTQEQTDLYNAIKARNVEKYLHNQTAGLKREMTIEELEAPRKKRKRDDKSFKELSDEEYFAQLDTQDPEEVIDLDEPTQESNKPRLKLANMLMSLRKACNHPWQMEWPVIEGTDELIVNQQLVSTSGKMMLLEKLLRALFARKHKVLIFSQFTAMLDILQVWAEDILHLHVSRIDGLVEQDIRKSLIKDFNMREERKLFLLSTRAGGLGINLTSADTVILFDSDWNPQVDLQAMDRVHRIGQTKPVIIYRLASRGTIETRILEKANFKRRLEKVVIQKGKFRSITSKNEVTSLHDLILEEAEAIEPKGDDDEIISDADLKVILDRSEAAYEPANAKDSTAFKAFTTVQDAQNDSLATFS